MLAIIILYFHQKVEKMNRKVLLLHGWGGSDYPHWQSWLAGEIAKNYATVSFFAFSDFENPKLDVWKDELKQQLKEFNPDIVICHSLANTLWFHLCNEGELKEIQKLILVAPPSNSSEIQELKSFFPLVTPQNLYAKEAILVTSTDDPYLTIDEAKELQETLGIEMKVLANAGHINADSGYGEWEWIYQQTTK